MEALAQLVPEDGFGRAALTFMLGNALNGFDYAAADQVYAEATLLGRAHGNARAAVMSLVNRALLAEQRADLLAAERLLEQALGLTAGAGGLPLPTAQAAYRLLGSVAYERNRLDEARRHLATAVDLARQGEQSFPLAMALSGMALVRQAQGDGTGALAAIDEAHMVAAAASLHQYGRLLEARRAELRLWQDDLPSAAVWAAAFAPEANWRPASHDGRNNIRALHLAFARVQIGLGAPDAALSVLARLAELAEAEQSPARAVELLALRALALESRGERAAAMGELAQALALATPTGSVRVFLDAGPHIATLLEAMKDEGGRMNLYVWGGLALILAAALIAGGGVLAAIAPGGGLNGPLVPLLYYLGTVATVPAFAALYVAHAQGAGRLGVAGFLLATIGAVLYSGPQLALVAGTAGAAGWHDIWAFAMGNVLLIGPPAFFSGMILLGIASGRGGSVPSWPGRLLAIGAAIWLVAYVLSTVPGLLTVASVVTGAGMVWMGSELITGRAAAAARSQLAV